MKNSEISDLVKITPSNFEDIAFRIENKDSHISIPSKQ
jgi:hypothetical protein